MNKKGIVTVLGTGTSQGVPVITCTCTVCKSSNSKDKRLRSSISVSTEAGTFIIDIGPDFRSQCLTYKINSLNAILITHDTMDHVNVLDRVRPFNYLKKMVMPIYAEERVLGEIRKRYSYIFEPIAYSGLPLIDLIPINPFSPILINDIEVLPLRIIHGSLPILGFKFGDFVYITDAKYLTAETIEAISDAKTLIINALHHKEHHSHLNLKEALELISVNNFKNVYLTHISHQMGLHSEVSKTLPTGVHLAYDGLKLEFEY